MNKILLIDLSSLFRPIWEMSGQEADQDHASRATVGAVHTMAAGYDHVAVCCDSRKSWRKELAPTYKANRPASQEPMLHQLRLAQEQLAKDGFQVWQVDGFEADDVIAAAVEQADKGQTHLNVTIASSDKDLCQLVRPGVSVKSLRSGDVMGAAEVEAKFGVAPGQIRDWIVMVGDKSDNIAGIERVGPKTAVDLLKKHGSLANVFAGLGDAAHCLNLTPALYTNIKESLHACELGRKLVTLPADPSHFGAYKLEIAFEKIFTPRVPQKLEELAQEDEMEVIDADTGEVSQASETKPDPRKSEPPPTQGKPEPTNVVQMRPADEPKNVSVALATVEWEAELEPRSPNQVVAYANKLFNARLFDGYGTPEGVMTTILLGRELGIGMMGSLRGIHLMDVRGKKKHALSADLMAALVLQSGKAKFFEPVKLTATEATYRTHRVGAAAPFEMTFNIAEAKLAGLIKAGGGWETWPLDMCKARCVARLARTIYPDVCFGLYVSEELEAA